MIKLINSVCLPSLHVCSSVKHFFIRCPNYVLHQFEVCNLSKLHLKIQCLLPSAYFSFHKKDQLEMSLCFDASKVATFRKIQLLLYFLL
jgi:hypothetical protein